MTGRTLGSLTAADLGASISATGTHGVLTSVRHFLTRSDPDAGAVTCCLVKVATAKSKEPDHREIRADSNTPVRITRAAERRGTTHAHAA